MTPFQALYGYDALSFSDMVFGDSKAPGVKDWVQDSQEILQALKNNLQVAQNHQKVYADKHMVERHFEVGAWSSYAYSHTSNLAQAQRGKEASPKVLWAV